MQPRPRENEVVRLISLFYMAMAAVGAALAWWRQSSFGLDPFGGATRDWPLHLAVTLGLVMGVHFSSRFAHQRFRSFRQGGRDVHRLLGNLTTPQIAIVALASGIGEELLFRGWLLHETNLWISSIIFGLIHVPPNRKWLYWPAFAAAMGVMIGWLYLWTGSLLYPILLHAGINFLNLRMMLPPTTVAHPRSL
jgi:uncharacterized protein